MIQEISASLLAAIKYVVTYVPKGETEEDKEADFGVHLDKWEVLLPRISERERVRMVGMGVQGVVINNEDGTCTKYCALSSDASEDDNELCNAMYAGEIGVGPKVYSYSVEELENGLFFCSYIMDLVDGVTLLKYIEEGNDVSWVNGVLQEQVSLMHSYGLVHKDLHRQNILVTGEGSLVFIDFGLSSSSGSVDEWWLEDDFNRSMVGVV